MIAADAVIQILVILDAPMFQILDASRNHQIFGPWKTGVFAHGKRTGPATPSRSDVVLFLALQIVVVFFGG